MDSRPTVELPDDDPYLWLENINGEEATSWVAEQNRRTESLLVDDMFWQVHQRLKETFNRPDKTVDLRRRGGYIYNFREDDAHPRGIWRRTTLKSLLADECDWDVLLDVNEIASAEGKEWFWNGVTTLPPVHDRVMVLLSDGGGDGVICREWDMTNRSFVKEGFELGKAKSDAAWLDEDMLLLMSTFGGSAHMTRSGNARTVRLWRRGHPLDKAPVIFSVPHSHVQARAWRNWTVMAERLVFADAISTIQQRSYIGSRIGPLRPLHVPETALWKSQGDNLAIRIREAWTIDETTYPGDAVLGVSLNQVLVEKPHPVVLWRAGRRSGLQEFFFGKDHLMLSFLEELRPCLAPSLPQLEVVNIALLDEHQYENDGTLLVAAEGPLTPTELSLVRTGELSTASVPLGTMRSTVLNDGLRVTLDEAEADDGECIPYIQTGPQNLFKGDAPVYITGYGGFQHTSLPRYSTAQGQLWLERGGTTVLALVRGGGEFGVQWHEAGRGNLKSRSYGDFAAVAADIIRRGITRPDRIAAEGVTHGGLLVANMHQHFPRLFGGLSSVLPLTDMRRYQLLHAGASWVGEYGEEWEHLAHISAYHCATAPSSNEPPILVTTNRRDDRVHPGHARKFVAKLQALGHRAWLYEEEDGSHRYGASKESTAKSLALRVIFLQESIGWWPTI